MSSPLRSRLTYANVMSSVAFFLALGGGAAWAANEFTGGNIRDGTLESRDLKDNAGVRSADVANDNQRAGGLTSADIRNNSLTSTDVKALTGADVIDDSLTGDDVDESSLGQVPNASSLNGRSASAFVANSTYRLGQGQERAGNVLGDGSKVLSQSCLAGDRLLSGGPASVNVNSDVLDSFAQDTSTWQARINDSAVSGGDSFTVVLLCADQ